MLLHCPCCRAPNDALELLRPSYITNKCHRCGTKFTLRRVNHPGFGSSEVRRAFAWRSAQLGFEVRQAAFEERLVAAKLAPYAIEACIAATDNKNARFVGLGGVLELVPAWQNHVVTSYRPVVTPDHCATILARVGHFDWHGHEDTKPLVDSLNADDHLAMWRGVAAFAETAAGAAPRPRSAGGPPADAGPRGDPRRAGLAGVGAVPRVAPGRRVLVLAELKSRF